MSSARAGGGPFRAFTLGVGKHRCPLAAWMGRCPALVTGVCGSAWRQLCHRRCVTYSSLSHVRGERLPSEEFHHHVWHGRLRLSQGSGAGALGSGFHGMWRVHLVLVPSFFASQGSDVWNVLGYSGQEGLMLESLGYGRGWSLMHSTHHLLMPLSPGLGSMLTDSLETVPLPATHTSNP